MRHKSSLTLYILLKQLVMTNLSPVAVNRLVEPDNDGPIVEFVRDDQINDVESHRVQSRCTVDAGRYIEIKKLAVVR